MNSLERMAGGAPQQRAQPRQNLLHMEGLHDIIVGAGIEALDFVAPAVARGQHQDRHRPPGLAPVAEDRNAVLLRQADVEDDGVIRLRIAEKPALFAIVGAIDNIARLFKSQEI